MDVTWLGQSCFRLRGKNAAVITDPFPPSLGLRLPRQEAEVVTISHEHENHSYTQAVRDGAFEISGPGEYEVAGVSVIGFPTFHDTEKGARRGTNTVYLIEIDDVRICHLGDLGHALDDADAETVSSVDILLVPVGGRTAINAVQAAEVVRQLEPRFVIPMHYATPGVKVDLDSVDRFLKEMAVTNFEARPKLSVQATSSDEWETKVVVLEPKAEPR
jgi:L-ascorbate metabolism protein UlaG (beta-lactamase superfamily)